MAMAHPEPATRTDGGGFLEHGSVEAFGRTLVGRLAAAAAAANELPEGDEYAFLVSTSSAGAGAPPGDESFRQAMRRLKTRVLGLAQALIRHELPRNPPRVDDLDTDPDDVLDRFEAIVDTTDVLLERVDTFADEVRGLSNRPKVILGASATQEKGKDFYLFHGSNVLRPQLQFKDPVDNSHKPWIPLPYRRGEIPMPSDTAATGTTLSKEMEHHVAQLGVTMPAESQPLYPHPYYDKLINFEYLPEQLGSCVEQPFLPLESTPFTYISKEHELKELAQKLCQQKEFALDLEHHSYRSFQGFTCLMQISTRTEDFIVDTLALREHMHILSSSFHDPEIVKVLHGSDSDVLWLQQDFGLYIINMFDTGQACRVLEYPSFSLAYLLRHQCGVVTDKKYQLADWRIRPLPDEMLKYAREDTHYLLYIYDVLRNELIGRANMSNNLLLAVLNRSRELCLVQYEKPVYTPTSHLSLYNRFNYVFNETQMRVFAAVYKWRDTVAREEDESYRYVLPNHMLFHIAEVMPNSVPSLLACCNPVPPLVRINADILVSAINSARAEPSPLENAPRWEMAYRPLMAPSHQRLGPSVENKQTPQPQQVLDTTIPATTISPRQSGAVPDHSLPSRLETPSPVLSKDELYSTAGWTSQSPKSLKATCSPLNQNYRTVIPRAGSGLYSSLVTSDSDSDHDEDKKTAKLIASSISTQGILPWYEVMETQSEELSAQPSAATPVVDPAMADVPKSMDEIYSISNKNRKRNKEKRKRKENSKESPAEPFSPVKFDVSDDSFDGTENDSMQGDRKKKKPNDMNDEEFMKSIGWAAAPEDGERNQAEANNLVPFDYSAAPVPFASGTPDHTFNPRGTRSSGRQQSQQRGNSQQGSFDPHSNFNTSGGSGGRNRGGRTFQRKEQTRAQTFGSSRGSDSRGQWPRR